MHPFNEGSTAFLAGLLVTDNPYPTDSREFNAWNHGWETESDLHDEWLERQP